MDHPFNFTLSDVMTVCNFILVLAAVGALILNVMKKANEPNAKQDQAIRDIKNQLIEHSAEFAKLRGYLDSDKHRLDELEIQSRNTNRVIIQTLQVLVRNGIDGNNVEELREADKGLNRYLLEERW